MGLFGEAGVGLATAVEILRHCRAQSMVRAARTRLSQEGREGWATCHPVSAEAGHAGRSTPEFWGLCELAGHSTAAHTEGMGSGQAAPCSPEAKALHQQQQGVSAV